MADQEGYEAQARDWLDSVDVPPPRLEVAQIVQLGRAQVRRRRLLAVGGTAAVLAAVAAIPAAVPLMPLVGGGQWPGSGPSLPVLDCDIAELPLPDEITEGVDGGHPYAAAAAVDPTGRFVVGAVEADEPNWLIRWEDGNPTAISPLRGSAYAADVNADGVVVGYGWGDEPDNYYAWIYRDGDMLELPMPDGYVSAEAVAINAAGDVVGTVRDDGYRASVVVWPADDLDHPQVLAGPPDMEVTANEITDDGTVIGGVFTPTAHDGGYLWAPDGTGQPLPGPVEAVDVTLWAARGGWAAGNALMSVPTSDDDPGELTVVWDLSAGTFRLHDLGTIATVSDVTAAGDVLYAEALVLRDGEPYALPHPIREGTVSAPGWFHQAYVAADAISEDGSTIVGSVSFDGSEAVYALMWRC
jgi:uncharacterized membrane protein